MPTLPELMPVPVPLMKPPMSCEMRWSGLSVVMRWPGVSPNTS